MLVHGLGRTWRSMKKPRKFLEQHGYTVLNLRYPSTKYPIETLAHRYLHEFVQTHCTDQTKHLHFLTHSMGGILVRYYLNEHMPENLGRVVMLAPPNQGSEVVDWEKNQFFFRWILGPAGQQLGTESTGLPSRLGPVNFELGVIAGDRSIEFFHSWLIPGRNDGKVAVERTKVQGMQDFLLVHNTHTFIMWAAEVLHQTAHFFKTGKFQKNIPGSLCEGEQKEHAERV